MSTSQEVWLTQLINSFDERFQQMNQRMNQIENISIRAYNASALRAEDKIIPLKNNQGIYPTSFPMNKGQLFSGDINLLTQLMQFYDLELDHNVEIEVSSDSEPDEDAYMAPETNDDDFLIKKQMRVIIARYVGIRV